MNQTYEIRLLKYLPSVPRNCRNLDWKVSISLEIVFYIDPLGVAIKQRNRQPEMFNTNQGSFISDCS